jgi:hypothetical protein
MNFSSDRIMQGQYFKTMTGMDISKMTGKEQHDFLSTLSGGQINDATMKQVNELGKGPASMDTIVRTLEKVGDPVKQIIQLLTDIAKMVGGGVLAGVGWIMEQSGHRDFGEQLVNEGSQMATSNFKELNNVMKLGAPHYATASKNPIVNLEHATEDKLSQTGPLGSAAAGILSMATMNLNVAIDINDKLTGKITRIVRQVQAQQHSAALRGGHPPA